MGAGEHTDPGARLADMGLARGRAPRDGRPAAPDAHHDAGLQSVARVARAGAGGRRGRAGGHAGVRERGEGRE